MKRVKKGERGYLQAQRRILSVRTAVLFCLSLAVYLLGIWSTGSNKNLLTIVAVLGCLPASRSAVNTVMFFRCRGIGAADAEKIAPHEGGLCRLYDLVFTSYEKNFEVHHMTVTDGCLVGYSANPACDAAACEKHLKAMCAQNGIRDVDIKIFRELPKYLNRLDALRAAGTEAQTARMEKPERAQEEAAEKQARLVSLLCAISL